MAHSQPVRVVDLSDSIHRSEADLAASVHRIYREWRAGAAVLVIAPALGVTAEELLQRAEQLGLPPDPGAAVLVRALHHSGLPATLLDLDDAALFEHGIAVVPATPALTGGRADRPLPSVAPREPLRVALLGCGTVGGGVLARLLAHPEVFRVAGVAVRDLEKPGRSGPLLPLLTTDVNELVERDADVVVELLGGRETARRAIERALELGRSVVTANKLLLAEDVDRLARIGRHGEALRFSASVGGALPALEAARRFAGRIRAISGVLNGTCNFVLDRCSAGVPLDEAVAEARAAGFAEADPALDLDGSDAAQKLALLAREAFGVLPPWDRIPRRGILELGPPALLEARRRGRVMRLVAACEHDGSGLRARVELVELPATHPFARAAGAGNALRIETTDGVLLDLAAQGAGRWPTCEAVMADLYDLAAERSARSEEVAA
jgi:homoserine dehydrogenase